MSLCALQFNNFRLNEHDEREHEGISILFIDLIMREVITYLGKSIGLSYQLSTVS